MTQPSARTCPRCRMQLHPRQLGTSTLDSCAQCGGVWIDHSAAQRLVQALGGELAQMGQWAGNQAQGKGAIDLNAIAPCSACGHAMERIRLAETVDVDLCKAHGSWFDRNEIETVAAYYVKRAPKPAVAAPQAKPSPASKSPSKIEETSALDVASGAANVAMLLLDIFL